ncbi:hypothetical protein BZA77DRAFT_358582 [Pyronema omphalodes]|nr:hypothetical protein BZA77DRAFT_358582 [Pyronema omphalodes]
MVNSADNSVNKKPEAGNKTDERPADQNQSSAHSLEATKRTEPIQQEQSSCWQTRTLSNQEVGLVLAAAGVGGMGPMISGDSNIFRFWPQKNKK